MHFFFFLEIVVSDTSQVSVTSEIILDYFPSYNSNIRKLTQNFSLRCIKKDPALQTPPPPPTHKEGVIFKLKFASLMKTMINFIQINVIGL